MGSPILLTGALTATVIGATLRRDGGVSATLEFRWDGDVVLTDHGILSDGRRRAQMAGELARHTGEDVSEAERALGRLAGQLSAELEAEDGGKKAKNKTGADVILRPLAGVRPETVSWLWYPYIPKGKVTLIEGDPGVGKSWLALALATSISLGHGLPGIAPTTPQDVLLLSAEDGLADTIRPRLDALDADVAHVFALEGPLVLDAKGLDVLDAQIGVVRPALVVLDPLVAYLGANVDLNRANETRTVMAALAATAERHGCAIVAVRHLAKSGRDRAIYRGIGSIDLTAACRSVLLVGCDPQDATKRALVQVKSNLAPMGDAVGYAVTDGRFVWTGASDLTADRILAPNVGDASEQRSALDQAVEFLRDVLAHGPKPVTDVQNDAKAAGIAEMTLRRARERLNVKVRRHGEPGRRGGGAWCWELPTSSELDAPDDFDVQGSLLGAEEHLNQFVPKSHGAGASVEHLRLSPCMT